MKNAARFFLALALASLGYILVLPIALIALSKWGLVKIVHLLTLWLEPRYISWDQVFHFDPHIGWKPKPNLDTYSLARWDDVYHILTDQDGWPGNSPIDESDVIVFGDSFAFGYGIDSNKSYLHLNPRLRIKAIACPGYNMVQELLLMRQYSDKLKNKLVLWFIYLENDIYDNLMPWAMGCYRTPFLRQTKDMEGWEIVTNHLNPDPWKHGDRSRKYSQFLSKLFTPSQLSDRAFSACDFLVQEAKEVCHQSNANLLITTIPYVYQLSPLVQKFRQKYAESEKKFDADYPDKCIEQICRKHKAEFFPLKKILKVDDYKKFEKIHWREQGHIKVANFISQAYLSHNNKTLPLIQSYNSYS